MDIFHKILHDYWGYNQFRPLQEDIVRSAYEGRDTLALMPTGGGKSITFQVPAMAKEGICLVVTPLIALMKDQVENLKKRNIKSMAIYSGMTRHEMDVAFDNAAYGDYKFLYLSPERLGTELFRVRVQKMNVNLLAIDEAHCISQWGYDFRPSYLQIAAVRELLPKIPVLALTATATPKVAEDIMDKLNFRERNLLQKSFERKNLIYVVRKAEDKNKQLLRICRSVNGTGIVYARNRKNTEEIAHLLKANNVDAEFYHAGITSEMRNVKQDAWKKGSTRVMVCTNAFGMGIDKADVRFVVHLDLPESVEAYFQEAGRAGRDEKTAYAVLLYNEGDNLKTRQRFQTSFPSMETIQQVYQLLYSHYNYPYGAGKDTINDFSLMEFAVKYKIHSLTAHSAIKALQREGYLEVTDELDNPTRIIFSISRDELYKIQVANPDLDRFIKIVLRTYSGMFNDYTNIDESYLAQLSNLSVTQVNEYLLRLSQINVIKYIPKKRTPLLIFKEERLDEKNLHISREQYGDLKERYETRMNAMLQYASSADKCRSQQLLAYFGEKASCSCGKCDVCIARNELDLSKHEFDMLLGTIKTVVSENSFSIEQCVDNIKTSPDKTLKVLRWLIDNENIREASNGTLQWEKL